MSSDFSEDALVEQPAIALFQELGYGFANCYQEKCGPAGTHGRETTADVILWPKLRAALQLLNPELPVEGIESAVEQLGKDRRAMGMANANEEVYQLLKKGVPVTYTNDVGDDVEDRARVIDWETPENNDFCLTSQFWISGEMHKRRTDLIGFVNGLPLLFIELKSAHSKLVNAYKGNLRDYKDTIPQLFWFNALIILSNGSQTRVGSMTAGWEHFAEWKRINSEGEQGVISLETVIRGTCEKGRFLDLVENFTVFDSSKGGLVKITAKNHQFLGVNKSVEALREIKDNQGKLGVFWHTQGSGKSYSMVFFSQKVLRKVPGNWTFLVLTDREELDQQISENFKHTGVSQEDCRARSGAELRQMLKEDHRFVFSLIQKFGHERPKNAPQGWTPTGPYPKLSDRADIIVMTDEAHRSQYDELALNMRNALPNAAFIGFTGTPLMAGEERTKEVFGDYVSIYNFRQSVEDQATVPLYYENRIPELQLENEDFNEELNALMDEAELNAEQEQKLEREFAREYHLITRDDRLEKVAEDLVAHFMGRKQSGKAMMVCIDKQTAVKMFHKVKVYWGAYLADLKAKLPLTDELKRPELEALIQYMGTTDMAVVVSQQQNEVDDFKKLKLEIKPHRDRMVKEDLEQKFKDADDPFRLVFVCAMWLTGFDAPSVSTIYLDKPMKNHTLMQTMARANRVFGEKNNGLIVDYVGVFRDMKKALAIYGANQTTGATDEKECPVQRKGLLIVALKSAIAEALAFCTARGVEVEKILKADGFQRIAFLDDAANVLVEKKVEDAVADEAEKILINDDLKRQFTTLVGQVVRLYKAITPDPKANEFAAIKTCLAVLGEKIRTFIEDVSIDEVMGKVGELLDASIAPVGDTFRATEESSVIDLSEIDFEALKKHFEKGRKRTEVEKLRKAIGEKLAKMVLQNRSRADLLEKFKKLIDEYNKGLNVDAMIASLFEFAGELTEEDKRGVAEQLSEEELAVFDLLTKPELELTPKERKDVKAVARKLLQTLKEAKLVLDWRKKQRTRADVYTTVKTILDDLPRTFTPELFTLKCDAVYQHIYDSYAGERASVYQGA